MLYLLLSIVILITIKDSNNTKYREEYRAKISGFYNGWLHFSLTSLISISIIVLGISRLENVLSWQWITIPLTFIYANLVEYLGHKGPMHHPRKYLKVIYQRHAKQHHVFFTHIHMPFDDTKDFRAVLFPISLILFFFGLIGVPTWFIINGLFSANVAWLFTITSIAYFLNYEWLHFAYHCSEDSWIMHVPGFKTLRQLHLHHHDPQLMTKYNFNITYPICDIIFGTFYKRPKQ